MSDPNDVPRWARVGRPAPSPRPRTDAAVVGVDLASQPGSTAFCRLDFRDGAAQVTALTVGIDDEQLLAQCAPADAIGIDAPFGWPLPFVELVTANRQPTPRGVAWDREETRQALRLRATDFVVWQQVTRRPPLSVSSDLIALPAMRCLGLLQRLGVTDRSGDGRVFETYPAAALAIWLGKSAGYKGPKKRSVLEALADGLQRRVPWLELPPLCRQSDDAFDAVVAALTARAAQLGLVHPIPEPHRGRAKVEGWIALPQADALERMGAGS